MREQHRRHRLIRARLDGVRGDQELRHAAERVEGAGEEGEPPLGGLARLCLGGPPGVPLDRPQPLARLELLEEQLLSPGWPLQPELRAGVEAVAERLGHIKVHEREQPAPVAQAARQVREPQPVDGRHRLHPAEQRRHGRRLLGAVGRGGREVGVGGAAGAARLVKHDPDRREPRQRHVADEAPQQLERRLAVPLDEELGAAVQVGRVAEQRGARRLHRAQRNLNVLELRGAVDGGQPQRRR